jgi:uncharacterized protein YlzI (FlbEa/FlbD family)
MSSNVPLLIELHETVFVREEENVWSGAFMADICHIEHIESAQPESYVNDKEEWINERKKHNIEKDWGYYSIPHTTIVTIDGRKIKVIETYEEIREKIAKAGVVVP